MLFPSPPLLFLFAPAPLFFEFQKNLLIVSILLAMAVKNVNMVDLAQRGKTTYIQ
jgi:hypothetical protein